MWHTYISKFEISLIDLLSELLLDYLVSILRNYDSTLFYDFTFKWNHTSQVCATATEVS